MLLFVCSSRRVLKGLSFTRRRTCSCRSLPSAGDRRRLSLRETAGKRSVRTPLSCCGRAVSHHATALTACLSGFIIAEVSSVLLLCISPIIGDGQFVPHLATPSCLGPGQSVHFRDTPRTVVAYSQPHTTRLLRQQQQLTPNCICFPPQPALIREATVSLPVWRFRGPHWKL